MKKTELEARVTELEAKAAEDALNGEAIEECRAALKDVGHDRTFFTDGVASIVQELKALRYDVERFRQASVWRMDVRVASTGPRPKRTDKEKRTGSDWVALAT